MNYKEIRDKLKNDQENFKYLIADYKEISKALH